MFLFIGYKMIKGGAFGDSGGTKGSWDKMTA